MLNIVTGKSLYSVIHFSQPVVALFSIVIVIRAISRKSEINCVHTHSQLPKTEQKDYFEEKCVYYAIISLRDRISVLELIMVSQTVNNSLPLSFYFLTASLSVY